MSIFLANHCDIYNQQLSLRLIELGLPVSTIISTKLDFFKHKHLPRNLKIFDIYDFYYREKVLKLNEKSRSCLSQSDIKQYLETESLFLKISDRLTYKPISTHEKLSLYYELLLFWLTYFRNNQIKLVVFSQTPHTGFDNVIYDIAKKRQIATLVVTPTSIKDRVMLREDFLKELKVPKGFLKNATHKELINLVDPSLLNDSMSDGAWTTIAKGINSSALKNNQKFVIPRVALRVLTNLVRQPAKHILPLFRRSTSSGLVFNGFYSGLQEQLLTVRYYLQKLELFNFYQSLSKRVALKQSYLFFPLHYQPERTTMPEAEVFENQLLALKIISKAIPDNWKIYVKEHPRQFALNDIRTNLFRDKQYYLQLVKIPKIVLVDINIDSILLQSKAKLTASIQGTSGWESLLMHKPTIIFANAWYAACQSSYQVDSVANCSAAIKKCSSVLPNKVERDLLKFLIYAKKRLIVSAFYHQPAALSQVPYTTLLNNLAVAIKRYYQKIS
ncbi:MAG: hypothetical protein COY81_00295 [Candidatus Pacebacteria bacterium CG_4_10_14_0_8_um_filter_43_12]|nr:MAG: hypothetical protein COY81_00295 [Candidatus Pacebacteria bacterium CG_4_10_14_0_8_um_filter_43_12]